MYYDVIAKSINESKKYPAWKYYQGYCLKDINNDGIPEMICRYKNTSTKDVIVMPTGARVGSGATNYAIFCYNKKSDYVQWISKFYAYNKPETNKWETCIEYNPRTQKIMYTHIFSAYVLNKQKEIEEHHDYREIYIYKVNPNINTAFSNKFHYLENKTTGNCYFGSKKMSQKKAYKLIMSKYEKKGSVKISSLKYIKTNAMMKKLKKGFK